MDNEPSPELTAPAPSDSVPAERTRRRRAPEWLPRALFESLVIVFSVLLALALNEWRDDRRQAEQARLAVAAVAAEMEGNRDVVAEALEDHRSIVDTLTAIAATGTLPPPEVVNQGLFRPANPVATAWGSARDAGALETWPYDLLLRVSRVYEGQARYVDLGRQLSADIYTDIRQRGVDVVMQAGYAGFIVLAQDFAGREETLLRQYDELLVALDQYVE